MEWIGDHFLVCLSLSLKLSMRSISAVLAVAVSRVAVLQMFKKLVQKSKVIEPQCIWIFNLIIVSLHCCGFYPSFTAAALDPAIGVQLSHFRTYGRANSSTAGYALGTISSHINKHGNIVFEELSERPLNLVN
jgi:hypothetical protein